MDWCFFYKLGVLWFDCILCSSVGKVGFRVIFGGLVGMDLECFDEVCLIVLWGANLVVFNLYLWLCV